MDRVRSCHEAVVGRFIVSQFLLPRELTIKFETILVVLVLQIEVFLACNKLLDLLNRLLITHCTACDACNFNTLTLDHEIA